MNLGWVSDKSTKDSKFFYPDSLSSFKASIHLESNKGNTEENYFTKLSLEIAAKNTVNPLKADTLTLISESSKYLEKISLKELACLINKSSSKEYSQVISIMYIKALLILDS